MNYPAANNGVSKAISDPLRPKGRGIEPEKRLKSHHELKISEYMLHELNTAGL
jgi:hypothetical protein